MRNITLFFMIFAGFIFDVSADYDNEMRTSMQCLKLFAKNEYRYRIPGDTLHSISLNETGKIHSTKKIRMTWPWTVNVEGKGYFFDSKEEAARFVRKQIIMGKDSIDVGCMQVNLKHHRTAFRSVEEALEPKFNIKYAAKFLRTKYDNLQNWHKAIAHYHSATHSLGEKYKNNVIETANNIEKYIKPFKEHKVEKIVVSKRSIVYRSAKPLNNPNNPKYRSNMMVRVPKKTNSEI